jgi:hypothetical protein
MGVVCHTLVFHATLAVLGLHLLCDDALGGCIVALTSALVFGFDAAFR